MKCGNCKHSHSTVEEVRACYGARIMATAVAPRLPAQAVLPFEKPVPSVKDRTPTPAALLIEAEPITFKQSAFLNKLLDERPMLRDVENLWPDNIAKLSKKDASAKINEVLSIPREAETAPSVMESVTSILEGVEDGYYAIPCKTGHNDLDFIRLSSNKGKFDPSRKGTRYVNRFIGGTGTVRITRPEQIEFAKIIKALTVEERREAQARFGQEIGSCGVCGKSLTDEISRARGIGPKCWSGS